MSIRKPEIFLEKTGSRDVFERMIDKTQRADEVIVCSFAVDENFLRRLTKAREKIGKLTLILDFTLARRNRTRLIRAAELADELYCGNTHAKLFLIRSAEYSAVCALSANATTNYRYECGTILADRESIEVAENLIEKMKKDCVRIER